MQIRPNDPSRSKSIEDTYEPSTPTPSGKPVDRAEPNWDRIPTLDTSALASIQSGSADEKALLPKLEKLQRDVRELHDALAPYARECKELHHGLHEIEEAIEMIKKAKHVGFLAPAVVGLAIAKAEHGWHAIARGWEGMHREAPEAARKAQPALTKVMDDIADIKAALTPTLERPLSVRA